VQLREGVRSKCNLGTRGESEALVVVCRRCDFSTWQAVEVLGIPRGQTPPLPMNDVLAKARDYEHTYRIIGRAHYLAADRCTRFNRLLQIPVIVITAVIGTTIFSTLNDNPDPRWKMAAGFITLAGTILSSLQASLGFAQTGQRHKAAGEAYRAMCRKFEMLHLRYLNAGSAERSKAMDEMDKVVAELADLAGDYPAMPDSCYDAAKKEVGERLQLEERKAN
jgi:hypothetical protein